MYTAYPKTRRGVRRRVYLPYERVQVNGVGLGELDGFNIGKMFKNAIKFTPRSFQLKNVLGTIGSGMANVFTLGMASAIAPKVFSAHSKTMRAVGTGVVAVAAVAGAVATGGALLAATAPAVGTGTAAATGAVAAGTAAASGGIGFGTLVSGAGVLMTGAKMLMGGGGGSMSVDMGPQQQPGPVQQVAQDQYGMPVPLFNPAGSQYYQNQLSPTVYPTMPDVSQASYSQPVAPDAQVPMIGLEPEEQANMINVTGQPMQASMFPELSATTWMAIGGVALLGWYVLVGSEKK